MPINPQRKPAPQVVQTLKRNAILAAFVAGQAVGILMSFLAGLGH